MGIRVAPNGTHCVVIGEYATAGGVVSADVPIAISVCSVDEMNSFRPPWSRHLNGSE